MAAISEVVGFPLLSEQEESHSDKFTDGRTFEGGDIEAGASSQFTNGRTLEGGVIEAEASGQDSYIDKWTSSLTKLLHDVPHHMCNPGHPGRISRIPDNLRENEKKSYEPCFLSIGPYHRDTPAVQPMERTKWTVLKYLLQLKPELTLKHYLKEIRSIEKEARSFYSDVEMDSQQFVLMLLLDSIYLLLLFCGMPKSRGRVNLEDSTSTHYNENMQRMVVDKLDETASGQDCGPRFFSPLFIHDLFLLENQIPFFVLQKLHSLAYEGSETQLISIVTNTIANAMVDYTNLDSQIFISHKEEVHHLLHLCHMFFRPTLQQESTRLKFAESSQMFRLGSAVQLYEAGVQFVARPYSSPHSLLDITFNNSGIIVMPCLSVDDNTSTLLRNLIALEQMKYPNLGLDITAYIVLLLHLITTPEDARLLRRKGLIQHHLASDKEMMYLVNKLSVGLSFDYAEDNYSLKPVFQELKRYTERRVPRWRAWLKHRYFNNPWMTISLVAAFILLLLSFVETFFTVYSYYQPCYNCI